MKLSTAHATSAQFKTQSKGKNGNSAFSPTFLELWFDLVQSRSDLSPKERIAYTNAVLCFQAKPPITDPAFAPGARSRFDDFIVTHMNQTFSIHATVRPSARIYIQSNLWLTNFGQGNFLSWHRYFVHAYEKALRKECGYKGYQPYWNWGRYAA